MFENRLETCKSDLYKSDTCKRLATSSLFLRLEMRKLFLAEEKKVERNYENKGSNYSIPWHSIIFRGRFFHQNASLHLT